MPERIVTLHHNAKDVTGQTFGRLIARHPVRVIRPKRNYAGWLCQCECGKTHIVVTGDLIAGRVKSCGCLVVDFLVELNTTHGMKKSPEWRTWASMKTSCMSKKSPAYKYYGARGISICSEWINSFEIFYTDMRKQPTQKHSIERINNNGNYTPDNCIWTTSKQQARNRRDTRWLEFNGQTRCMADWADRTGIKYPTLQARINKLGWSVEKALSKPIGAIK